MCQGNPHDIIDNMATVLTGEGKLPFSPKINQYFANFQVIIAKKVHIEIVILGQINIAVNGEYLSQVSSHICQ